MANGGDSGESDEASSNNGKESDKEVRRQCEGKAGESSSFCCNCTRSQVKAALDKLLERFSGANRKRDCHCAVFKVGVEKGWMTGPFRNQFVSAREETICALGRHKALKLIEMAHKATVTRAASSSLPSGTRQLPTLPATATAPSHTPAGGRWQRWQ